MSFKGCLYLKPSIVPTILHRQNVHLNNFLPRRYKCRSAKRVQQYITTSNNPQLSSTQSISSRNVICSHLYMTTSQIVPDCSSQNNATKPKYSKDSLDPTTYDSYFHDYKCYPNFTCLPDDQLVDERFKDIEEKDRPLVLLFGWAGANGKNLSKYSDIYRKAGCITLGYNLPTRFIFQITEKTPFISKRILEEIENAGVNKRPVFLHLMSDTGVMVRQGLDVVLKSEGKSLDIRGCILDSCPGQRPKLTVPKLMALLIVNWVCGFRDGLSFAAVLKSEIELITTRVWPYIKDGYFKGEEPVLSEMNNMWCGDHIRFENEKWPELFLYSKGDFYVPHTYLDEEVIRRHVASGRDVTTKLWEKSSHVCHLKNHKKSYSEEVHNFLDKSYFSHVKEKAD